MDVDSMLGFFSEDMPSGDDLEYDPIFTDLEIAAQPGEERVMGDQVIAAEDPDWVEVKRLSTEILGRSHDIRAAVYLGHAELRTRGFEGFAEVLHYIRDALEKRWDTVHPQLDPDDDNDPTMRVNAVVALTDTQGVLRAVRLAPLTDSRGFGRWGLRHLQVASGEIAPPPDMEMAPDSATINAAFQDTDPERLTEISAAVQKCLEHARAIEDGMTEKIGAQGPDLSPLTDALKTCVQQIGSYVVAEGDAPDEVDAAGDEPAAGGAPIARAVGGAIGGIASPADVTKALDRLIDYYNRNEPSSPVPLLLHRAKRLVSADFLTIMRDMAPDGIENVNRVAGIAEQEGESW